MCGPGDIGASQRCRRNRRCRGHIMETQNEGLENKDRVAKLIFLGVFCFINLWFFFCFSDVQKQYIYIYLSQKKQTFGEPESTPMNFLFGFQIPMTTFRLMRRTGRLVRQQSAGSGPCHLWPMCQGNAKCVFVRGWNPLKTKGQTGSTSIFSQIDTVFVDTQWYFRWIRFEQNWLGILFDGWWNVMKCVMFESQMSFLPPSIADTQFIQSFVASAGMPQNRAWELLSVHLVGIIWMSH